jgi:hypothetical protein
MGRMPVVVRTRRVLVAVSLSAVLSLGVVGTLSGCGVQSVVKNVTHGNVDLGGTAVPPDFPSAVPLVHGTVVFGASAGSTGRKVWNVTVRVHDADAIAEISGQLADAGFRRSFSSSTSTGATVRFMKQPYAVLVVVEQDQKNGWVANYTVTRRA